MLHQRAGSLKHVLPHAQSWMDAPVGKPATSAEESLAAQAATLWGGRPSKVMTSQTSSGICQHLLLEAWAGLQLHCPCCNQVWKEVEEACVQLAVLRQHLQPQLSVCGASGLSGAEPFRACWLRSCPTWIQGPSLYNLNRQCISHEGSGNRHHCVKVDSRADLVAKRALQNAGFCWPFPAVVAEAE